MGVNVGWHLSQNFPAQDRRFAEIMQIILALSFIDQLRDISQPARAACNWAKLQYCSSVFPVHNYL